MLIIYIYQKDHGHNIRRCDKKFPYFYKEKIHYYYPDFIVDNEYIVEIKGFETELDLLKYTLVPGICVIKGEDIIPYINYVKETYKVEDITSLYECVHT